MNTGRGSWGAGNKEADTLPPATTPLVNPAFAYRAAHDAVNELQHGLQGYEQQVSKVIQHINTLASSVESLRQHYEAVVEERDYMNRSLEAAEGRMLDVQRVVQRYASVTDPVVASDGFTYEREVITNYLNECQALKNVPMSQQTHTELTMLLFPNRSFKRFLEQLMETKPADMRTDVASSHGNHSGSANAAAQGRATGNGQNNHRNETNSKGANAGAAGGERLHPCVRVYGYCNYKDTCAYALYPYDACLSHLKGKCRFRSQCHERHVDFRGPLNNTPANGEGRGNSANAAA
ncbi:RNA-binding protein [Trypanosoma grayi]|uniref:RNA-binding protein n=1 Tax=Trypanosoma grayi TaxID=71804 RepID=UPI0004F43916|nr:RNA-binding protein [Trypanosoma grayi]KEG08547.1 RNA-binding protein [Trypanosoma grayi]